MEKKKRNALTKKINTTSLICTNQLILSLLSKKHFSKPIKKCCRDFTVCWINTEMWGLKFSVHTHFLSIHQPFNKRDLLVEGGVIYLLWFMWKIHLMWHCVAKNSTRVIIVNQDKVQAERIWKNVHLFRHITLLLSDCPPPHPTHSLSFSSLVSSCRFSGALVSGLSKVSGGQACRTQSFTAGHQLMYRSISAYTHTSSASCQKSG